MKLAHIHQLLEMPTLKPEEMPPRAPARPFFSMGSLARNYEFIHKGQTSEGEEYWCVIKKDKQTSAIGIPGVRSDGVRGMDVIGTADFKSSVVLSGLERIPVGPHILQIELAEVVSNRQNRGWGMYLYTSLAEAGYVIISDNTQYLGGHALWKRIARETMQGRYHVYVLKHGEPVLDDSGQPKVYDGTNIDDSELWSTNSDQKYTLFALKRI